MEEKLTIKGRFFTEKDIEFIRSVISRHWDKGRSYISKYICQEWGWVHANGMLKDMACREMLRKLEKKGYITLPQSKRNQRWRTTMQRRSIEVQVDITAIEGNVKDFQDIELRMVRWTEDEKLFRFLIEKYHYLGYNQIVGEHLKYIAYFNGRPMACLGWGAAAWKVKCRDEYIGWTKKQRERNLHLIVNNTRFLVLPWVHVFSLASFILAKQSKVLSADWHRVYAHPVMLLETFVDKRFMGTSYKASNWQYLGETTGRGRGDRYHKHSKPVKSVFVYPLHKDFRKILCNG